MKKSLLWFSIIIIGLISLYFFACDQQALDECYDDCESEYDYCTATSTYPGSCSEKEVWCEEDCEEAYGCGG